MQGKLWYCNMTMTLSKKNTLYNITHVCSFYMSEFLRQPFVTLNYILKDPILSLCSYLVKEMLTLCNTKHQYNIA